MRTDARGTVVAALCRDRSIDVLYEADRHAQAFACDLVICHVAASAMQLEEYGATLRARAGAAIGRAARDLEVVVTVGDPATEILRIAHERRAELVVVGSPRHGRLHGLLRGCTLERVLHQADTPVLVARECPHTRNAHCSVLVVPVPATRVELPAVGSALQWRPT